jgi:deoxyribonuclease-2
MLVSPISDGTARQVDWWFIYKLPQGVGPRNHTTGDEYLYCDSQWHSTLHLSNYRLNDDKNALTLTLKQAFGKDAEAGYILWNDEIPPKKGRPKPANNKSKGHTKGLLVFNERSNSGYYLLHSTPRFPAENEIELPDDEREYGQTFLCISLTFSTLQQIAEVIRTHHEPQIYASKHLSSEENCSLVRLAKGDHGPKDPNQPLVSDFRFRSRERVEFRLFAKNKKWSEPNRQAPNGKDFWNHLVGPALCDDIDVETWRRGQVFENFDPGTNQSTLDVLSVSLGGIGLSEYEWPFTKDHAKWGSTEHRPPGFLLRHPGYVIIADINRDESQAKRSGGGIAFQHDEIWNALKSVGLSKGIHQSRSHKKRAA